MSAYNKENVLLQFYILAKL